MASLGANYDLSAATFSPDGRVFQIEYAAKAVDNSNTVAAMVCKDGIIFGVEKLLIDKMAIPSSTPRIFAVDVHCTIVIAGFLADGREIVRRARLEAAEYKHVFSEPIPGSVLADRLALFIHAYTLVSTERPFGTAVLLGVCDPQLYNCIDENLNFSLYSIDNAGTCYQYKGTALGKGRQLVKTEMEKLVLKEMTCDEGLVAFAGIMSKINEESKDKVLYLEAAWICNKSDWKHETLSQLKIKEAQAEAQRQLEAAEDDVTMQE